MARKKVNLIYITDESTRKTTFRKRRNGLIKKVDELSTLCGIQACVILYSCFDSQPSVWPSADGANRVLRKFKNMSELDQGKRRMDQESFLRQRIEKANQQLKKQCLANRELEMTKVMLENLRGESSVENLMNVMDLNDLKWVIQENLKEINSSLAAL
ncbi:Agamous-like MADS-box protein A [Tripterygium wilfordii]|uniref:Agamous-like MADS-box protein A n=1 Tax=Tripterygium wilfordii TaxID=458696 RepID=A0A7J7CLY2_TRIWF|nr:agamous-like MADS-box protein AGL80 [Tripterygium wilfordii]KAF5735031.1 Agamous-like MADS-box protein A [Tripterygium wilfordii]